LWVLEEIDYCWQEDIRHAGVAWHKRNIVRKNQTTDQVEQGALKGWEETVEGPRIQKWNKEPRHTSRAAYENQREHHMGLTGRLSD
jgi:hypothetical protein